MHSIQIPNWAHARYTSIHGDSTLDPTKTALVVIDMQNFFMVEGQGMANPHAIDIVPGINRLAGALRQAGGIVVFTQQSFAYEDTDKPAPRAIECAGSTMIGMRESLRPGSFGFELYSALDVWSDDIVLTKYRPSVFHPHSDTELDEMLRQKGIDTLIVTGVITNGCCECTARDAMQYNYKVIFPADGNATFSDEEHNATLLNLAGLFAEVVMIDELVAELST
jgi:ureidoacrylate peracid hydrolase